MKIIYNILVKKIIIIGLFMLSFTGFAQSFTVFLANGTNPTPNTLEVDVQITVNSPPCGVRLASVAFGVNYDPAILNGGTPCTLINCGSWDLAAAIPPPLSALNPTSNTNRAAPVGHLRCTMINLIATAAINLLPGTYTIGRYRFTNTVPFTLNSNASLWMQPTNAGGSTNTIVSFYPCGATTPLSAYTTILPAGGAGLTLPNTVTNPFSIPLNTVVCATTGSFTQTPVTCFGGSNGTATITMASATATVPCPP